MDSIFNESFIHIIVLPNLVCIMRVLLMHLSKGKFNNLVIAISEDTAAIASHRSMATAGIPGAVSTIQVRKFTCKYMMLVCVCSQMYCSHIRFGTEPVFVNCTCADFFLISFTQARLEVKMLTEHYSNFEVTTVQSLDCEVRYKKLMMLSTFKLLLLFA